MQVDRRELMLGTAAVAASGLAGPLGAQAPADTLAVRIDTRAVSGPLPHVWEECAGSDRAAITLRERWRQDLDRWRTEAGLKRVRFHGIFADELGVYAPSLMKRGQSVPNFQNVFEVYDGLVDRGVAPFVEIGFMPKALASGTRTFGFYQANITPPKSLDAWGDFIAQFVGALVTRYGLETVRRWPFEVWNEANLSFFWSGTQQDYFDLYRATAAAVKRVDGQIMVGGPSTSKAQWLGELAAYCRQNNAPIDFFSTHVYAGDRQAEVFGKDAPPVSQNDVIPLAIANARRTIEASGFAGRPLWLSEWSSDSPAMIAHVIAGCLPHLQGMSQWVLSGTYEELGVADYVFKEGDNGWATIMRGIARPSFNTYKLLHALGDRRLAAEGPALASRRAGGGVAALVWNLAEVKQPSGIPGASSTREVTGARKRMQVRFAGARAGATARVRFVDQERGSPLPAWRRMGSPQYLTQAQTAELRRAADMIPTATMRLNAAGELSLDLPPEGVALIELG